MKTLLEVDSLLAKPRPLSAANDEFVSLVVQPASGWDPYEVWRTRIKVAQEDLKSASRVIS